MRIQLTLLLAAGLVSASAIAAEKNGIYAEYWDYELGRNPFQATTSGDYRFNDRVPDVSESVATRTPAKARRVCIAARRGRRYAECRYPALHTPARTGARRIRPLAHPVSVGRRFPHGRRLRRLLYPFRGDRRLPRLPRPARSAAPLSRAEPHQHADRHRSGLHAAARDHAEHPAVIRFAGDGIGRDTPAVCAVPRDAGRPGRKQQEATS